MLGDRCPPPKMVSSGPSTFRSPAPPKPDIQSPESPSKKKAPPTPTQIIMGGTPEQRLKSERMLEIQLKQILSRYNYRGDRDRLVKAISTVIGEKKTLAEVSATTGIAQTTLSTYVRIARLFVKNLVSGGCSALADEEAANGENLNLNSSSNSTPDSKLVLRGISVVAGPAKSVETKKEMGAKAIGMDPSAVKVEPMEVGKSEGSTGTISGSGGCARKSAIANLISFVLGKEKKFLMGEDEDEELEYEHQRMKAILLHIVHCQYRRGGQQQKMLIDALEDVSCFFF